MTITPETIAELRRVSDLFNEGKMAIPLGPVFHHLPVLLDAAERLAVVEAERDALRGQLFDAGYREAEMRAENEALAASVARVRVALDSHPDPTRYQYASKGPISCGWKSALIDVHRALADGSGS